MTDMHSVLITDEELLCLQNHITQLQFRGGGSTTQSIMLLQGLINRMRAAEKQSDFFKLRIDTDNQHAEQAKSHGVPDWLSHNWPVVLFCDGKWYGVREGFEFRPDYDYKGFPTFSLTREQGAFICHGTYDGDWTKSLTKRPPSFVPICSANALN